jgi:hypothetical protein
MKINFGHLFFIGQNSWCVNAITASNPFLLFHTVVKGDLYTVPGLGVDKYLKTGPTRLNRREDSKPSG